MIIIMTKVHIGGAHIGGRLVFPCCSGYYHCQYYYHYCDYVLFVLSKLYDYVCYDICCLRGTEARGHTAMIIMVRVYLYGHDYLYGYALWWVDFCWIIYMDMIMIYMLHLGGTQTGSYQTGSYQKGRFIPPKPKLSYLLLFDTTPFICL